MFEGHRTLLFLYIYAAALSSSSSVSCHIGGKAEVWGGQLKLQLGQLSGGYGRGLKDGASLLLASPRKNEFLTKNWRVLVNSSRLRGIFVCALDTT